MPSQLIPAGALAEENQLVIRATKDFNLEILVEKDGRYTTRTIQTLAIWHIYPLICEHGFKIFDGPCTLFLFDHKDHKEGSALKGPRWIVGPGNLEALELKIVFTVSQTDKTVVARPFFDAPNGAPENPRSHMRLLSVLATAGRENLDLVPERLLQKMLDETPL